MNKNYFIVFTVSVIFLTSIGLLAIAVQMQRDTSPLVVYVAGKYYDPTDEGRLNNTNKAIDAGIDVIRKCNFAIVPHLYYYLDKRMEPKLEKGLPGGLVRAARTFGVPF